MEEIICKNCAQNDFEYINSCTIKCTYCGSLYVSSVTIPRKGDKCFEPIWNMDGSSMLCGKIMDDSSVKNFYVKEAMILAYAPTPLKKIATSLQTGYMKD